MKNRLITALIAFIMMAIAFFAVGTLTGWNIFQSRSETWTTILFCLILGLYIYGTAYLARSRRSEESKLSSVGIYGALGLIPVAFSLAALILIFSSQSKLAYLMATLAIGSQFICLLVAKISFNIVDEVAWRNNYRGEHIVWRTKIGELQSIADEDFYKTRLSDLMESLSYLSRSPYSADDDSTQEIEKRIDNIKKSIQVNDRSLFSSECEGLERKLSLRQAILNLTKEKI